MKKRENQFTAVFLGIFTLVFVFLILRNVADFINNGFSFGLIISTTMMFILVVNLIRYAIMFYKKGQELNLK